MRQIRFGFLTLLLLLITCIITDVSSKAHAQTVSGITIDLNPETSEGSIQPGEVMRGDGSISGAGNGTIAYKWVTTLPDGSEFESSKLSTTMTNGSAPIPEYDGWATNGVGTCLVRVEIISPASSSNVRSNVESFTVSESTSLSITDVELEIYFWKRDGEIFETERPIDSVEGLVAVQINFTGTGQEDFHYTLHQTYPDGTVKTHDRTEFFSGENEINYIDLLGNDPGIPGEYKVYVETLDPSTGIIRVSNEVMYTVVAPNPPPLSITDVHLEIYFWIKNRKVFESERPIDSVEGRVAVRINFTGTDYEEFHYILNQINPDGTVKTHDRTEFFSWENEINYIDLLGNDPGIPGQYKAQVEVLDPATGITRVSNEVTYTVEGTIFTVTEAEIDLTPEPSVGEVPLGRSVSGRGTITGGGEGLVEYRWNVEQPDGTDFSSPTLSANMFKGVATAPEYTGFPTTMEGLYKVQLEVLSPATVFSETENYRVEPKRPTVAWNSSVSGSPEN